MKILNNFFLKSLILRKNFLTHNDVDLVYLIVTNVFKNKFQLFYFVKSLSNSKRYSDCLGESLRQ